MNGLTKEKLGKITDINSKYNHFLTRIWPVGKGSRGRIVMSYRFESEPIGRFIVRAYDNNENVPQKWLDDIYSAVEEYVTNRNLI